MPASGLGTFAIVSGIETTDGEKITLEKNRAPNWLTGVWKRKSLWLKDAEPDYSTRVFYIQTPTLYGDIRIPASRFCGRNATSLKDLNQNQLYELTLQEGFAGHVETADDVVTWHRYIDFQPPGEIPDVGRCRVNKPYMIETGIHLDYSEKWLQIDDGNGQFLAMHSCGNRSDLANRILVVAGNHFLYARGRNYRLNPMKSLNHLLQSGVFSREQVIGYLDCEFSYGRIRGGRKPWEISLSTLPFKEGHSIRPF